MAPVHTELIKKVDQLLDEIKIKADKLGCLIFTFYKVDNITLYQKIFETTEKHPVPSPLQMDPSSQPGSFSIVSISTTSRF